MNRNKQFIAALQLFEQIVIDTPYIDGDKQYEWLQGSLKAADSEKDDLTQYSVLQILEYLIDDSLFDKKQKRKSMMTDDKDRKRSMVMDIDRITEDIEIPTFIKTQLGFFRHCLRESEYCKLCFDMKKLELLPKSIKDHFMNDRGMAFDSWCRLFPNDRRILIKNVDPSKYQSFINLFGSFVAEMTSVYTDSLQCIEINTGKHIYDENMNALVIKKNDTTFKYANWTVSYEAVKHQIGDKDIYSILMSRNQIDTGSASDEKEKEDTDIIVQSEDAKEVDDVETKDESINETVNIEKTDEPKPEMEIVTSIKPQQTLSMILRRYGHKNR